MKYKILIVDREPIVGLGIINNLKLQNCQIVFVDKAATAIKEVRTTQYALIVLGDRIKSGDTYDVALNIKLSMANRTTTIICINIIPARTVRLSRLLKPYSIVVDSADLTDDVLSRVGDRLKEVSHS